MKRYLFVGLRMSVHDAGRAGAAGVHRRVDGLRRAVRVGGAGRGAAGTAVEAHRARAGAVPAAAAERRRHHRHRVDAGEHDGLRRHLLEIILVARLQLLADHLLGPRHVLDRALDRDDALKVEAVDVVDAARTEKPEQVLSQRRGSFIASNPHDFYIDKFLSILDS